MIEVSKHIIEYMKYRTTHEYKYQFMTVTIYQMSIHQQKETLSSLPTDFIKMGMETCLFW